MPKATKPHYQKKNPAAHEAWMKRKLALRNNLVGFDLKKSEQKSWRINSLLLRMSRTLESSILGSVFTIKNEAEVTRLGYKLVRDFSTGQPIGMKRA